MKKLSKKSKFGFLKREKHTSTSGKKYWAMAEDR